MAAVVGAPILELLSPSIELNVVDDGVGFVAGERTRSGLGLRSIHERVRFMRGSVSVDSRPGEGTKVRVRIPIGAAHNELAMSASESDTRTTKVR